MEKSVSHQAAQRAEVDRFNKNRPGATRSRSQEPCFEPTLIVQYIINARRACARGL